MTFCKLILGAWSPWATQLRTKERRMRMSNDAKMLRMIKDTLDGLALTYQNSNFETQQQLEPQIQDLRDQYDALRGKMNGNANLITAADLTQMSQIRDEIDQAADTQALILAIARVAFFVGTKL